MSWYLLEGEGEQVMSMGWGLREVFSPALTRGFLEGWGEE